MLIGQICQKSLCRTSENKCRCFSQQWLLDKQDLLAERQYNVTLLEEEEFRKVMIFFANCEYILHNLIWHYRNAPDNELCITNALLFLFEAVCQFFQINAKMH